jgi:hypothetical protein
MRTAGWIIKGSSPPTRCEVCHQSDLFDPQTNFCQRCAGLTLPAPPESAHPDAPTGARLLRGLRFSNAWLGKSALIFAMLAMVYVNLGGLNVSIVSRFVFALTALAALSTGAALASSVFLTVAYAAYEIGLEAARDFRRLRRRAAARLTTRAAPKSLPPTPNRRDA